MNKVIEVSNLRKSYGTVEAVKGIDFYVNEGTLFAFLGPNGAGKSTTIDIICTLLQPNSGKVLINGLELGRDDDRIRSAIGVVFQDSVLDPLLTVKENLMTRGKFYGMSSTKLKQAIDEAAHAADVMDFLNRPYGKLSGGQRRRADIARALVNTPKILFLDEPTTGLDPQTRRSVWQTIQKLQKDKGMTVFLTTHYMEEAANADYVTVIDHGLIAAQGTPSELKERYSTDYLKLTAIDPDQLTQVLDASLTQYTMAQGAHLIKLTSTMDAIPLLNTYENYISGFEVVRGTMDDVFITITGSEVREDVEHRTA
ncbi:ABC transporter ATP-binding protein [Paenibacillus albiflavus]|uniref:ABC transporter ATP-binding protein n=1 Tax=Paenibacillus albiflavus TaxID=2545760 RepID=A0A4R4ECW0_9BACL|nr:ATP-binding cassette domain-containing protein [Paenibacillus albiflavus]TCZ75805.1 ABC transporter ATP-binding protein [Paenibacillus albiflavus]